jgi:hypothetical protein
MSDQLSSPGKSTLESIGKKPTGAQTKGEADVKLYADVETGKGPATTISTEMDCPLGKVPTGAKTGGL